MFILGTRVDITSYENVLWQIHEWQTRNKSRFICFANVHMVMVAYDSKPFQDLVNQADVVTPDGIPLVWLLRLKGTKNQKRVYGPTFMLQVLEMAAKENIPVGFYGSDPVTLKNLIARMYAKYPGLNVAYAFSPPYRTLSSREDDEIYQQIQASGIRILFVGLGCPKQERWMAAQREKIPAVMLGVGAAFDFHAGAVRQAPGWIQAAGMEWFYRFTQEPRRLWKRYLFHNPRFVVLALAELLGIIRTRD